MNFAGAKENIQPLAAGRNVEQLEVALNAECQEELLQQRKQYEQDILNYAGDDPLDLWFDYVTWVEQSYPKSGKESALDDLLKKCLSTFEKVDRYKQDPRFIRLFIKYVSLRHLFSAIGHDLTLNQKIISHRSMPRKLLISTTQNCTTMVLGRWLRIYTLHGHTTTT